MKQITMLLLASMVIMFTGCNNNDDPVVDPPIVGEDNVAPVITLLGTTPITLTEGEVYTDAGATAMDDVDGDITGNIVTVNPVDTSTVGQYTVTYNVEDAAGNAATEITRTVIVAADEPEELITGTLDSTFGTGGIVVSNGIVEDSTGMDMALDGSGNVYVAGYAPNASGDDNMVIWKYDSNGTLDSTFGTNGMVVVSDLSSVGTYSDISGQSIELDGSGNIYVAGIANGSGGDDVMIWKFDSTGTPVSTFGTDGIVVSAPVSGGQYDNTWFFWLMKLDGSGNIYLAGPVLNQGKRDMALLKYDSTGALDLNFGTNGMVVDSDTAGGDGNDGPGGLALDGSGNIYMSGYSLNGAGGYDMVIWKYDSTGTLDSTFGTGGIVVSDGAAGVADSTDDTWGLALDGSGNIYVAGHATNSAGDYDMVIWKYDGTGTPDSTFGTDGIVVSAGAAGGTNADDYSRDIKLDSNGNIYVTGFSGNSAGDEDMVVWKYDSTGTPVSTFGTDGIVVSDGAAGVANVDDRGVAMELDGSGNLYVMGSSLQKMVIWNYN